jgi:hypothetical protein
MASTSKDEVAKDDTVVDKPDASKPDELEDEVKLTPEEEAVRATAGEKASHLSSPG